MKKNLIALAVAAAAFSAPAFADASLYGTLDAAFVDVNNTNQKSQALMVTDGLSASRLGVKASEDLGDGLKAVVQYEIGLDSQDSATGFTAPARQKLLGLSSASMGTIATGYLQTTGYDFGMKFDPTAESSVSPLQNMTKAGANGFLIGTNAGATRAQRALAYISPSLSGFTVAVNYSTAFVGAGNLGIASSAADQNISGVLVSAYYDAGSLSVGGVYGSTSVQANSNADQKEYALGASYDFNVAKLSGTYQATHNGLAGNAGNTNHIYSLSGVVPAGSAGNVVLSYANAKINTDTTGNSDGKSFTAGFLHPMSKTLTAYVAWSRVDNNAAGAFSVANDIVVNTAASASSNLWGLGLSKKF